MTTEEQRPCVVRDCGGAMVEKVDFEAESLDPERRLIWTFGLCADHKPGYDKGDNIDIDQGRIDIWVRVQEARQ